MSINPYFNLPARQRIGYAERLGSPRREEREAAADTLRNMGSDPVLFLLDELRAMPHVAQWKFSAVRFTQNFAHFCIEFAIYALTPPPGKLGRMANPNPDQIEPPVPMPPTLSEEQRHRRRVGKVIRGLAWQNDLRVIGPLCERLPEADEDTQWRAQITLKSLLPRLTPQEFPLLTPNQKTYLYRLLRTNDMTLLCAAVQAIGAVGEARVRHEIELLTVHLDSAVRLAAQQALPLLCERERHKRESQTLLRGSCAPPAPETLLRPAYGVSPAHPNELMRPSQPENHSPLSQETNNHHA